MICTAVLGPGYASKDLVRTTTSEGECVSDRPHAMAEVGVNVCFQKITEIVRYSPPIPKSESCGGTIQQAVGV